MSDEATIREALRPHHYTGPLEQKRIDACLALEALVGRLQTLEAALGWYAERKNYAPAVGETQYAAVTARDSYDGEGPGARARAALRKEGAGDA